VGSFLFPGDTVIVLSDVAASTEPFKSMFQNFAYSDPATSLKMRNVLKNDTFTQNLQ